VTFTFCLYFAHLKAEEGLESAAVVDDSGKLIASLCVNDLKVPCILIVHFLLFRDLLVEIVIFFLTLSLAFLRENGAVDGGVNQFQVDFS
jgi:hypothetical protein